MYLIADSGSTKCNWLLTNNDGEQLGRYDTIGFNPLFQSSEDIALEIKQNEGLFAIAPQVQKVYYYGAGVSSDAKARIVRRALSHVFAGAEVITGHDLTAAAYASYNGSTCICCILGTGSNSCLFDGNHLIEKVPSLGFILGDEGSGAYFGKQLVSAYLYNKLPDDMVRELEKGYGLTKTDIFEAVYQKPRPNVYLARLAPFIHKHKHHPLLADILHKGFVAFITEHVLCYENAKQLPVNFVGSIAHIFSNELHKAAEECGITIGEIVKQPIERLVKYHVERVFNQE